MITEWIRQKINNDIDEVSDKFTSIEYDHHEIHEGDAYFINYSSLLNAAGIIEVRLQTPNTTTRLHAVLTLQSSLYSIVKIWEATTKTHVVGNAITPFNRDRNSSNASTATVCHTPAGAQAGDPTWQEYIGAATVSGRSDSGGAYGGRHERMLKQNTAYLLHIISGVNTNSCTIIVDWYENG